MDDTDTRRGDLADGDTTHVDALDRIVDPIVAVVNGVVVEANDAAIEAFDVGDEPEPAAEALEGVWDRLEPALEETAVGTARTVSLEDDRFDARVHRDVDGATITFDRSEATLVQDRALKERAIDETPVGVAISDPDREDNPLIYVNDAFQRITGYPFEEVVGQNCRFLQGQASDPETVDEMRTAIDEGRPVTVEVKNYRKDGTEFWNEVTIAPIEDGDGEVTHYVGFQNDITARKEAELEAERRREELREERAELEELLERVEGLVTDVTATVAGSASRNDLEKAVCDRIATDPTISGAWIGERAPATGAVTPRTSAGIDGDPSAAEDHPAVRALESGEFVAEAVDGVTIAAAPLTHNDVEYGVLVVHSEEALDDRREAILSALARAVASGINARETSRMLVTDSVVAVELEVVDDAVAPIALANAADCDLEYRRSVHRTDEETASLFTATGASMADLEATAAELEGVSLEPIVEREEECLVELRDDGNVVEWLTDRGAVAREINVSDGTAHLTLEMPRSANVRSVVEDVEERYPGTDVVSFQQRERGGETRQEFAASLEEELTDRQLAALRRAFLGGYFEWPRPTTGEELAQSMGVSRPTFHEHLRTAEEKLCRAFFGD
ncbi:bacterio-opsin activator domain-containing protein [Natrialbaceae archaeon A-gly3]